MDEPLRVIVIGGGIGGLAAALGLHRVGAKVAVYERAPELREVGAGIALWANAVKALKYLGLESQILPMGIPQPSLTFYTPSGRRMVSIPWDKMTRRFGEAAIIAHRADFFGVLYGALPPGTARLGMTCFNIIQNKDDVRVQFSDNTRATADVVIGADGLHSTVRDQLFEPKPPRYGGYIAWRAVTRFPADQLTPGETLGRGLRFGQAALTRGRAYWYATRTAPEGQAGQGQLKKELLMLFKGWHKPIPDLIEATDESAILRNDTYDRVPLHHWSEKRVTLLGDAAHPMMPDLGQGACQAIEDAVALSRSLKTGKVDVPEALREYENHRLLRTSAIVRESREYSEVAQWQNPWACMGRNFIMSTPFFRGKLLRKWDGLMGYEP